MEQTRNNFMAVMLKNLPREVVSVIRDYDPIYRDYFTKNIIRNMSVEVSNFWTNRLIDYTSNIKRYYNVNYSRNLDRYFYNISNIPLKTVNEGLFIAD